MFVVFALSLIACAVANLPPSLPNEFSAGEQLTVLGFTLPGILYWEYNNFQSYRIDSVAFGTKVTDVYRYDLEIPVHYQYNTATQECTVEQLDGELFSMAIPPFASFQGVETIDGVSTEHWSIDWFGSNLDWWAFVNDTEKRDGILVRFTLDSQLSFQLDFTKVVPGPQDASLFALPPYCPPPTPPVTFTVQGYLQSAIDLSPITNAAVQLDTTTVTTDNNGVFTFTGVPAGIYELKASPNSFFAANKTLNVTTDILAGSFADLQCAPIITSGSYTIVLSWGSTPADLDSHMLSPGGCETYYRYKKCISGNAVVVLDVDDTHGFGPETIGANNIVSVPGIYKYFVYIYSAGSYIGSNAVVSVYGGGGLLGTFSVPQTGYNPSFRTWNVFQIDAANGVIQVINQVNQ